MKKYVSEDDLLDFMLNYETWEFTLETGDIINKNIIISPYSNEVWVFELEDGTTVSKGVIIK